METSEEAPVVVSVSIKLKSVHGAAAPRARSRALRCLQLQIPWIAVAANVSVALEIQAGLCMSTSAALPESLGCEHPAGRR